MTDEIKPVLARRSLGAGRPARLRRRAVCARLAAPWRVPYGLRGAWLKRGLARQVWDALVTIHSPLVTVLLIASDVE